MWHPLIYFALATISSTLQLVLCNHFSQFPRRSLKRAASTVIILFYPLSGASKVQRDLPAAFLMLEKTKKLSNSRSGCLSTFAKRLVASREAT